jgi:hypothetical protein
MPKVNRPIDVGLRRLIDGGAPISDAIRISLWRYLLTHGVTTDRHSRGSLVDFAAHRHLDARNFAASIYNGRAANPEMLAALIEALGGDSEEWRDLLWRATKPVDVEPAAATA